MFSGQTPGGETSAVKVFPIIIGLVVMGAVIGILIVYRRRTGRFSCNNLKLFTVLNLYIIYIILHTNETVEFIFR